MKLLGWSGLLRGAPSVRKTRLLFTILVLSLCLAFETLRAYFVMTSTMLKLCTVPTCVHPTSRPSVGQFHCLADDLHPSSLTFFCGSCQSGIRIGLFLSDVELLSQACSLHDLALGHSHSVVKLRSLLFSPWRVLGFRHMFQAPRLYCMLYVDERGHFCDIER
ncbi:hypothetical protein BDR06DRAFT_1016977 [Suillus hirtellus]|nr:hypothetical protein BDR06DRAFT_1016977 [Suillus hirtellus]